MIIVAILIAMKLHCKWSVTEAYDLFSFFTKTWSGGGQQSTYYGHSVTSVTCC